LYDLLSVSLCLEETTTIAGVDFLEAQIVGEVADVDVEDVDEDEDVSKIMMTIHLEETTLIVKARWMSWFRSGRGHHRTTYREVGLHRALGEDADVRGLDPDLDQVRLNEEETPLVVGWVPEVEDEDEDGEYPMLPEHDRALALIPIGTETDQTHLSLNSSTLTDRISNLLYSCRQYLQGHCFKRRKIFCSLWLRVPVRVKKAMFLLQIALLACSVEKLFPLHPRHLQKTVFLMMRRNCRRSTLLIWEICSSFILLGLRLAPVPHKSLLLHTRRYSPGCITREITLLQLPHPV
jgi:hypothetical protein